MSELIFTFLGTGTSQGIPVLGCKCEVCRSTDPRDDRLRTSLLVTDCTTNIVIDAGPDFRLQLLRAELDSLDALLITHEHNDHVAGLDDVRPFNFKSGKTMPIYSSKRVLEEISTRFAYIFDEDDYPGRPRIALKEVSPYNEMQVGTISFTPFWVYHGNLPVLAFQFSNFTYITDANRIPAEAFPLIKDTEVLVLNALHHRKHHSHFNLEEAIEQSRFIGAKQTYFTHISHQMGLTKEVEKSLPDGVDLAVDELEVRVPVKEKAGNRH